MTLSWIHYRLPFRVFSISLLLMASICFSATPSAWKGVTNPPPRKTNYALPTGTTIDAVIENAIFSYNLISPTIAFLDSPFVLNNAIVFPAQTKFLGSVQVVHSLDRVNIVFHTCVFPNGEEVSIDALALSIDGSAGVRGKVQKYKDAQAAKIAMKSVLVGIQTSQSALPPTIESGATSNLTQDALSTLDQTPIKTLQSISIDEHTAIKIYLKRRLEY